MRPFCRTVALSLMALGTLFLSMPATAEDAILTEVPCPYPDGTVPKDYTPACSRMAWSDAGVEYKTLIAVFTPNETSDAVPMVYIPGGPGDAPIDEEAEIASILALFPQRTLVTVNPRGVKGAQPRPTCTFDADFWDETITRERETEITTDCRDEVTLDLARLDAPHLAQDIDRMITALGLQKAGVYSVSYGTESALHLLVARPEWLERVILDSVSLPGALGTVERLQARDRFLGVIDRLCFAERQCPRSITRKYDDLLDWVAQFDDDPVNIRLGPDDKLWSLDGQEILDFIGSMASYPDGAGYGPIFVEALEDSRADTVTWIASEMENSFSYALNNFALLYGAFSDSEERMLPVPEAGDTIYPFKVDDYRAYARLFRLWNTENRTEPRFISPQSERELAPVPVLVLSGGVDSLTPIEWAVELHQRFSGLTHFVFPEVGHAVAFGTDADVNDKTIAAQLNCGPDVVRAFVTNESYGACEIFRRKADND